MKTIGIIPARYESSRFPGKPLVEIGAKSMIRRVYEQASKAERIDEVIVATDDERIYRHVEEFGGQVRMTDAGHRSGTDRCAEVAGQLTGASWIINIQGDEPFIDPRQIDQVIRPLQEAKADIATLARRIRRAEALFNPHVVKVVVDAGQKAMYFSRSPIPFGRDVPRESWPHSFPCYQHLGLYGFRREVLLEITRLPVSAYERAESLEQLRWLEAGYEIAVDFTEMETLGIDTPEDLQWVLARLEQLGE